MRNWSRLGEANFRFVRQPPTILTWAELHFYDLPLIRPSDLTGALVEQIIFKSLIAVYGFRGWSVAGKVLPQSTVGDHSLTPSGQSSS